MIKVIKRNGSVQNFNEKKIYLAIYESCLNAHLTKTEANEIAKAVTSEIKKKLGKKKWIESDTLFSMCINSLQKHSSDAMFLYETHRDIS